MINHPIPDLGNNRFSIVNSQLNHKKEKGYTICVTDILLHVLSNEIKAFFDKEGTITRFSIVTKEAWQLA